MEYRETLKLMKNCGKKNIFTPTIPVMLQLYEMKNKFRIATDS